MPTVDIFPTNASFEGWTGYNGDDVTEAAIEFINDSNNTTYVNTDTDSDATPLIGNITFSSNLLYSGNIINSITLTTTGKAQSAGPLLTQQLTTTHRGSTGISIASFSTIISGLFTSSTTYTNLAPPNSSETITDNHVDDLILNLSVPEGSLLILDIFIREDYTPAISRYIDISNGFVEVKEGHVII